MYWDLKWKYRYKIEVVMSRQSSQNSSKTVSKKDHREKKDKLIGVQNRALVRSLWMTHYVINCRRPIKFSNEWTKNEVFFIGLKEFEASLKMNHVTQFKMVTGWWTSSSHALFFKLCLSSLIFFDDMYVYCGVIHKSRGYIFGYFWPRPLPFLVTFTKF